MKTILFTIAATMVSLFASAQLKGSGKTISKTYEYTNFDKINFENLDGKLEVEVGKAFSINVTLDDNLLAIFSIKENAAEHELTVSFKDNWNNNKYIENTNFKIKITMPEASVIKTVGNADLNIKNLIGRYFRIEHVGNGDVKISGTINSLDVTKSGNGNIYSEKLSVEKAKVNNTGNGDVIVNVSDAIEAKLNGNGNIKNIGKARFSSTATKIGNGDLINQ